MRGLFPGKADTRFDINALYFTGNAISSPGASSNQFNEIFFKNDGLKLYTSTNINDSFFTESTLTRPYDISSISSTNDYLGSATFSEIGGSILSFWIDPSGTRLYVGENASAGDNVFRYTLGTPWDISTISYASDSVQVATGQSSFVLQAMQVSDDGTLLFVMSNNGSQGIIRRTMTTPFILSTSTSGSEVNVTPSTGNTRETFIFADDGNKYYEVYNDSGLKVDQYTCGTPYDLSTISLDGTASLGNHTANAEDVAFFVNDMGEYMYAGSAGAGSQLGQYNFV